MKLEKQVTKFSPDLEEGRPSSFQSQNPWDCSEQFQGLQSHQPSKHTKNP
jgi:hypothetical protein